VGAAALLATSPGGTAATDPASQVALIAQSQGPCDVISDADAASALDGPAERDTNPQSQLPGMCAWRSATVPGDALTVAEDAGGQQKFNFDRDRVSGAPLLGAGDAAFAFTSPAGFVQLGMMAKGRYVTLVLQLQGDDNRLARAEQLAQLIASRL
jgi:hypothetical protein